MSLAYHNLLQDKLRSMLSILGVGLAIMLILVLNGLLIGVDRATMPGQWRTPWILRSY
jgi:hypothetical protein